MFTKVVKNSEGPHGARSAIRVGADLKKLEMAGAFAVRLGGGFVRPSSKVDRNRNGLAGATNLHRWWKSPDATP